MISRSSPHLVIEFYLQMMMYTIDIKSVFLLHLLTHDFRHVKTTQATRQTALSLLTIDSCWQTRTEENDIPIFAAFSDWILLTDDDVYDWHKTSFSSPSVTHDFRSGIVVHLDINCCFKTSISSLHDCPHASGAGSLLIFPTESQLPTYIFILRLLNWLINLN